MKKIILVIIGAIALILMSTVSAIQVDSTTVFQIDNEGSATKVNVTFSVPMNFTNIAVGADYIIFTDGAHFVNINFTVSSGVQTNISFRKLSRSVLNYTYNMSTPNQQVWLNFTNLTPSNTFTMLLNGTFNTTQVSDSAGTLRISRNYTDGQRNNLMYTPTSIRIVATTPATNVLTISEQVFTIVGVFLIISVLLMIVVLMKHYGYL